MYSIPFSADISYKITQPTGEFAHEKYPESAYAIDFLVPLDTPVISARGGTVFKVKDDSDSWGLDKHFSTAVNYVAIDHGDGTFAEYLHLGKGRVVVEENQSISEGELLGYTGNSGCMDEPHLHLNLFKIIEGHVLSIPITFKKGG